MRVVQLEREREERESERERVSKLIKTKGELLEHSRLLSLISDNSLL